MRAERTGAGEAEPVQTPSAVPAGGDPEAALAQWRRYLLSRGTVSEADADELEDHLRAQIGAFREAGLAEDEAFLIAIKRVGAQHELAGEFAREHSRRLWKQLVLEESPRGRRLGGMLGAGVFAVLAAALVRVPELAGAGPVQAALGGLLLAAATLAGFVAWRRHTRGGPLAGAAAIVVVAAGLVFAYPFAQGSDTAVLFAVHLLVLLWLAVCLLYTGAGWRSAQRRMDAIRFTGEWLVYLSLIALGGGVLVALTSMVLAASGIDASEAIGSWAAPCGAAAAAVVAAWLVDAKQEVIENMAPVLGRIFTPLFAAAVLVMLAVASVTGGFAGNREVLIAIDLLLVIVLALVLYVLSAREEDAPAGWLDATQLLLVAGALALDGFALAAMAVRIAEAGITPNRLVALGVNVVLLVNLAVTAWLLARRVVPPREGAGAGLRTLLRWQTGYLPVYAAWSALVLVVVPPLFRFA